MRPGWQELLLQSLVLLGALVAAQEEDVYTQPGAIPPPGLTSLRKCIKFHRLNISEEGFTPLTKEQLDRINEGELEYPIFPDILGFAGGKNASLKKRSINEEELEFPGVMDFGGGINALPTQLPFMGDSGGPLAYKMYDPSLRTENFVYMIAGVTSFGKACAIAKIPAIYTRVSYYTSWIEKTVWPNEFIDDRIIFPSTYFPVRGDRLFGDRCETTSECGFDSSICEAGVCRCIEDYITNHIDKCGKKARVNESCFFHEQCQATTPSTECRGEICICGFDKKAALNPDGSFECIDFPDRGDKLFGDRCETTSECGFDSSICDAGVCRCIEDYVSNHIDKCGKKARVNESCFFDEQCEATTPSTECRGEICICRFEEKAVLNPDGSFKCIAVKNEIKSERYVDPAMIGILVAMFVMFIIICIVLRLFSRARWRENRSIFNTPNPRLMNVSLLRDSKLLHQERRGSRASVRGPSRQPSMASLRAHSPNSQGSRRGSKGSINESATSLRSNKTPTTAPQPNLAPLESVTVEIQDGKS